jgi:hypothetical protein
VNGISLIPPSRSYEFSQGLPKVAFIIFPGIQREESKKDVIYSGTLENLCLSSVQGDPILKCVDSFLECAQSLTSTSLRKHKSQLHAFLAVQPKAEDSKLAEAAKIGIWKWDHPSMGLFSEILKSM